MKPAIPFFDLKAQYRSVRPEIDEAIHAVLEGGSFIGGDEVAKFEKEFAAMHNSAHCVGVANGTDAILIAMKCLGIGPGDEVITPAFGWISASEMISMTGARPVFADVLGGGTLDPELIERLITVDTRAVVLMHLYGQAGEAQKLKSICDRRGIFLIEDCAQAHLTMENGRYAGTVGDAGTFSFYPTKNLGAYGDGGSILTTNESLAGELRLFANHGGLNQHLKEGINSRLDTLQAAVLSVKLRHLRAWTQARIAHAQHYFSRLSAIPELNLPEVRKNTVHTFHQFVIRTTRRDELKTFLNERNIQTLIHYPVAIHNLPAYEHFGHEEHHFPEATKCQREVLSLPIYPELSTDQVDQVCDAINEFFMTVQ